MPRRPLLLLTAALAAAVALSGCQSAGAPAEPPSDTGDEPAAALRYTPVDEPGGVSGCVQEGDTVLTLGDDPLPRTESLTFGDSDRAVILAHQAGQRPCSWNDYGRALAERGYRVFIPSLTGTPDAVMGAAVAWLTENGVTQYAMVGASMGGTYVLASAAALTPAPSLVVAISSPTEYAGVDALATIGDIRSPVLLVAGDGDQDFAAQAQRLAEAQPDAELLVVASRAHGTELRWGDAQVAERLDAALDEALG
ncbi:MAG: alpha/beta fold hydrolase [Protaetiibacter sp.]